MSKNAVGAARDKAEHDSDAAENGFSQLLAMADLVPLSQTLISPALSRLLNIDRQHEKLQATQKQGDPTEETEDPDAGKMRFMPAIASVNLQDGRGGFASFDASFEWSPLPLDGYGVQLSDGDGPDNRPAEGYGVDREYSSNSGDGGAGSSANSGGGARTLKRPRLVWTPQLHKRFVEAVSHVGIRNAVPKTVMQLMNVQGLTRENVASHLQKYRLYLKRVQRGSIFSNCEDPASKSLHRHCRPDHLLGLSEIPSTGMASASHGQHTPSLHLLPQPSNHSLQQQNIAIPLLQPVAQHQLYQAMTMVKSPPLFNLAPQIDSQLHTTVPMSTSPVKEAPWPFSYVDSNAEHRMESHCMPSSPPHQALALFPH